MFERSEFGCRIKGDENPKRRGKDLLFGVLSFSHLFFSHKRKGGDTVTFEDMLS